MTRPALVGGLTALLAAGCAGQSHTQSGPTSTTTDEYFRVESTPGTDIYYEARPQTPGSAYRVSVQQVISDFNGAP
jgi:hypothetical protein